MDTKNVGLYIGLNLCIFLALPYTVDASDLNSIEVNFVENNPDEVHIKNSAPKDPLKNITVSLDKKVTRQTDNSSLSKTNMRFEQQISIERTSNDDFTLKDNEYVQVKGIDNRTKLFNGSIIIKFILVPDLNHFALSNGILFVSDLSDINRGVFKISNLYQVEAKISQLKLDDNVLSIELDTIDPAIKIQ
jgi:hypothetical protein